MRHFALIFFSLLLCQVLYAQTDTTDMGFIGSVQERVWQRIHRDPKPDTVIKSEAVFMPYKGKIIRRIIINHVDFDRTISDTSRTIRNRIVSIGKSLHSTTKEKTIRENLFIRENRPLNPFLVADNERHLRDLDFILDAKIKVKRVKGRRDSVDLIITTRDVFSLGVTASTGGIKYYQIGLFDANLAGLGQRVQTNIGVGTDRNPPLGFEWLYEKTSMFGSLINGTIGYTQLDNARELGEEDEFAFYVKLDRPLFSPYSRLAGGFEVSQNWSRNVYNYSDSLFIKYRYNVGDLWAGYNIGIKNTTQNRNRYFVAMRYYQQYFLDRPDQEIHYSRALYNNNRFILGQLTFFKQDFYKTKYVLGFGRTEDVPYGHKVSITSGFTSELGLRRTYLGVDGSKGIVNKKGDFYQLNGGIGSFFNNGENEDAVVFLNGLHYSKLKVVKHYKLRQLTQVGYARALESNIRELLTLNNELQGFSPDSLYGTQRIFARTETTVFTNWKLAGFNFAPFMSLENAFLKQPEQKFIGKFYWGTTAGMRIRNENLIFGTIELRAFYFPQNVDGVDAFSFKITTNIRLRYTGRFVRPPSFISYNRTNFDFFDW